MTDDDLYIADSTPTEDPAGVWRCATCHTVIRQTATMTPDDLRAAARAHVTTAHPRKTS